MHWVGPELAVEVTYLTWTDDNLLRQVSYQGTSGGQASAAGGGLIPYPPGRRRPAFQAWLRQRGEQEPIRSPDRSRLQEDRMSE